MGYFIRRDGSWEKNGMYDRTNRLKKKINAFYNSNLQSHYNMAKAL